MVRKMQLLVDSLKGEFNMANVKKIHTGCKFYRYEEGRDEPIIVRVKNIDYDDNTIKLIGENSTVFKMKYSEFTSQYKMLSPDGIIIIANVSLSDNDDDVIVALNRFPKNREELKASDNVPYVVCRQMCADVFNMNPDEAMIGASVSQETCPSNVNFMLMLAASKINYKKPIAVYLDDTLDVILSLFDNRIFDDTLKKLHEKYINVKGSCSSLKELLEVNNFMYDFRKCFNIVEIPFSVNEDYEGLNEQNIAYLNNELKVQITQTYVVRYARDIDTSKFTRKFILAAAAQDKYSKVYIVGYDTLG